MVHPKLAVGLWASHSASLSLFILLQNVAKDSTAWDWYESRIGEIVSFNYFLSICYTVVTLIGVQDISVNNMGKNELHLSVRALSRNPSGRHSSIPRVHPLLRTDVPTPRPDAGVTVPTSHIRKGLGQLPSPTKLHHITNALCHPSQY